MFALGQKQTYAVQNGMSALSLKAEIAATKRKLANRALDVEFEPGHPCEQIDIGGPDRTSAEPYISSDQVERLSEHTNVLQEERIGERAVLPRNPAKASSNRD